MRDTPVLNRELAFSFPGGGTTAHIGSASLYWDESNHLIHFIDLTSAPPQAL